MLPQDTETASLWGKQGISSPRIVFLPKKITGGVLPELPDLAALIPKCFIGPKPLPLPQQFDPNDSTWVEIWNDVLIQYFKNDSSKYEKLVQNNIDTGMGVERTLAVLNDFSDNYQTPIWQPIIKKIEEISGQKYADNLNSMRIIADHLPRRCIYHCRWSRAVKQRSRLRSPSSDPPFCPPRQDNRHRK